MPGATQSLLLFVLLLTARRQEFFSWDHHSLKPQPHLALNRTRKAGAFGYCLLLNKHISVSLRCCSHCNISDRHHHQHLNQRKVKQPGFHNAKKNCSRWTNQIWTWLWEVMSCSVSEAAFLFFYFYKQLVAEQITLRGEPARYAGRRGCRHCEGWIITSPKMFFWLKAWNGRLAPQREDLKDPTSLTLLAWGRLLRQTTCKKGLFL